MSIALHNVLLQMFRDTILLPGYSDDWKLPVLDCNSMRIISCSCVLTFKMELYLCGDTCRPHEIDSRYEIALMMNLFSILVHKSEQEFRAIYPRASCKSRLIARLSDVAYCYL